MKTLGIDIGSSSVKVAVFDASNGTCSASAQAPSEEMAILSPQKGWAEQEPSTWWSYFVEALAEIGKKVKLNEIEAIGITYQMHGLVAVDNAGNTVRPSIIWCDSRAVQVGNDAFHKLGSEFCLSHLLNSPGNFTASKLAWVLNNEPDIYAKISKIMLPGDYIAFRLSGEATTTAQGLSEGMLWDYVSGDISSELLQTLSIDRSILSSIVPCFGNQGEVAHSVAQSLGLRAGIPICYRSGDQPNNAFSLNVLEPGEIAATAGTSGVVYGVSNDITYDPYSRVNTFMHVNHHESDPRLGVLLCINGTGILNSWLRRNVAKNLSYVEMNQLAESAPAGSSGLSVIPFGNGAERVLKNAEMGAHLLNIDFNIHSTAHILRAAQEGIAFSLNYGIDIMKTVGVSSNIIRAGIANLFQSNLFAQTVANISGATIELYDTNGAVGAARGAALGAGFYSNAKEAFSTLKVQQLVEPKNNEPLNEAYDKWKEFLNQLNTTK
jgi:xylulokinase